jgi:hypothetical protein
MRAIEFASKVVAGEGAQGWKVTASGLSGRAEESFDRDVLKGAALLQGFKVSFGGVDHKVLKASCSLGEAKRTGQKIECDVELNLEDDGGELPNAADCQVDVLFVAEIDTGLVAELVFAHEILAANADGVFNGEVHFDRPIRDNPQPQAALSRWDLCYDANPDAFGDKHYVRDLEVSFTSVQVTGTQRVKVEGKAQMADDSDNVSKFGHVEVWVFALAQ